MFKDQNRKKEYEYWNYWYSQQPNSNIRVFDVGEIVTASLLNHYSGTSPCQFSNTSPQREPQYRQSYFNPFLDERTCQNIDSISEIGCNAVSFTWNSNIGARVSTNTHFGAQYWVDTVQISTVYTVFLLYESLHGLSPEYYQIQPWTIHPPLQVVLRINCLSTEFSAQKGVKGTPLYVQLDTYEDSESSLNPEPADRCYSQIKVFRDKVRTPFDFFLSSNHLKITSTNQFFA